MLLQIMFGFLKNIDIVTKSVLLLLLQAVIWFIVTNSNLKEL